MSPKNIEEIENKNTMIQEIGQRATCPMALAYIYKHVEKSDSYIDFNQRNDEKQNIRKKTVLTCTRYSDEYGQTHHYGS